MLNGSGSKDALLEIRQLSVRFGGLAALQDVELVIDGRELVGIIGPNGAGKTTLFNAISRTVSVERGAVIRSQGVDVLRTKARLVPKVGIARTFQQIELAEGDTILDNVLTGGFLRYPRSAAWDLVRPLRGRKDEMELVETAKGYLSLFEIDPWTTVRARAAPYAVKKRAQICRALMTCPRVLLLDEPASGMTMAERDQLRTLVVELKTRLDLLVIIVEHDVKFLAEICSRMVALEFGRVIADDVPAKVISNERVLSAYMGAGSS